MKKMKILGLVLMSALSITGCNPAINEEADTNKVAQVESPEGEATSVEHENGEKVNLTISAAASLKEAMAQIETMYEVAHPNVDLTFTFGGSGALQQQIEQGAPADVFISAALKQMTALEEGGYILEDSKKELLENKVVLVVPTDSDAGLTSFEDVASDKVASLGLGEPGSVPVGQYAEEIFTSLGVLDLLKEESKIVYAKDVKEVLSWVATGNVDAGVVYATDAKTTDDVEVVCEAPAESYSPAIYPVAVIKESKSPDEAKTFVDYLSTDEVRTIFEDLGFTVK